MIEIQKIPDFFKVYVQDGEAADSNVEFIACEDRLSVYLTASLDKPRYIVLRWNCKPKPNTLVLGDHWERLYSDTYFRPLSCDKYYPWYFMAESNSQIDCGGVMVQPNSFVSFECDAEGVSCWLDVRCGGKGVELDGRRLHVADIVCRHYEEISSFDALKEFCKVMSPSPILPKAPVYGGNNWYYAYGNSSAEEILNDATLQAELAGNNENRPFMVIDDCWQKYHRSSGPWTPGEKFGDMKKLVSKINDMGVRTGIWVRFLSNDDVFEEHPEYRIVKPDTEETFLDPSRPEVLEIVRQDIERIKSWGFELLKHDYTSYDIFNGYGFSFHGSVDDRDDWSFYDTKRTSAEIVLDLYRTIRNTCGDDMLIIGCNTFSHLSAGLVQISRVGDDTSGMDWNRTRSYGINALAFRLPQHNAFYAVDADCAGFYNHSIPWELNSQWVDLLSKSGTPLFISCPNNYLTEEQKEFMKLAYRRASVQSDVAIPIDWKYNMTPNVWSINGEEEHYEWNKNTIPQFLKCSPRQK